MSGAMEMKVVFAAVDKFLRPVKAITQGASEASKALRENTAQAKELNRALGQIDAFKKVQADLAITANAFAANRKKIDELKASMAQVGVPTKEMVRDMARLEKESERLRSKHQALANQEQQLHEKLKAAGVDTSRLADERRRLASASAEATNASRRLSAALEAENQKMKKLHAARAQMEKTNATRDKVASFGGKALAAGTAVTAAGAAPVLAYAQAESSATDMKVAMMQKGGKVSEDFQKINDLAEKLGNRLPGTTSMFQDMMTMLLRQGMPVKSILGGLGEATAYLGVQLKMAPDAAAEFAAKLQDATRTTDKDMMGLMDTIQKTFYLGVDSGNMLQGFSKLSPAMQVLKKEGLEAANALAPLLVMADQAGMAGEAAGNAYRKIFQGALDAGKIAKGNKELAGTGISLDFTDGKGEFGGMDQMFKQLDKLKGVNTAQRLAALKKMFGDDAETLQALTLMIEKGADGYAEVQGKMENQASIQERVNTQLGTLKNLWDAAAGTFTNALVAFGESVAPELHATAEWLGKVAGNVQAWAKENPRLSAAIMTTVKWLGLFLLILGGIATAGAAILGPIAAIKFGLTAIGLSGGGAFAILSRGFSLITSAIGVVGRALLMNPIGLAVTGIALAAYLIYRNWEPIKAFFSGIWDNVKAAFNGGLTGILSLIANWSPIGMFYSAMAAVLSWFGIELPGKFTEFGANILAGLTAGIMNGIQAAKDAIGAAGDAVVGFFKEKLGIHSPSRVFAELGGFTMQGLEEGLSGNDGPLDAVSEMANKLTELGAGIKLKLGGPDLELPEAPAGDVGNAEGSPLISSIAGMMKKFASLGAGVGLSGMAMAADMPPVPVDLQPQAVLSKLKLGGPDLELPEAPAGDVGSAEGSQLISSIAGMMKKFASLGAGVGLSGMAMAADMPPVPVDLQPQAVLSKLMPAGLPSIGDMVKRLGESATESGGPASSAGDTADTPPLLQSITGMAKKIAGIASDLVIGDPASGKSDSRDDSPAGIAIDTRPPISPAAAAGGGGGSGGRSAGGNNYTIIIQGAGMSPQDIAAEVARAIEQFEAKKAARGRSRLRDSE